MCATAASNTLAFSFCRSGAKLRPTRPPQSTTLRRARARLEGRQARQRRGGEPLLPFVFGQIEPRRRKRLVVGLRRVLSVGGASRGIGIGDLRDALARGLLGARVEHEGRVADIVEQRVEPIVEKRQPVLEADRATALADGGIEFVVGGRGAEFGGVGLAEARIVSVVSRASLIGTRSSERNCPTLRCVSGSKARIDSSVSPKKSSRIGAAAPGG